jgi:biotin carboxyl carrier protein
VANPVSGKIAHLRVEPQVAANLASTVGGIVEDVSVTLGDSVTAFSFDQFYSQLGTTQMDPAVLQYNSAGISASPEVQASVLVTLRAESVKASLDAAVASRANAYYGGLGNIDAIVTQMEKSYGPQVGAKPGLLESLSGVATTIENTLSQAYAADNRRSVVKQTSDTLTSSDKASFNANSTTEHMDYAYRVPNAEANADNIRTQLSIVDEYASTFLQWKSILPNLGKVLTDQLAIIDHGIRHLQVGYLNTMLFSPIAGSVAAKRVSAGDTVVAGQPLLRVESGESIYLVGTIIFRGVIVAGTSVATVETSSSLGVPGRALILQGKVVAARGNRHGEDRWDIVVAVDQAGGRGVAGGSGPGLPYGIPLHYTFAQDDTTIAIA